MRDQLYRKPVRLKSHTDDSGSFFGALGFTVPVEELTLRTTSLANVLNWLTQPKGHHLVDETSTPDSLTALAILVTPEALYNPDSPRVELGLVYKAPYIQAASFNEAYFFLKSASRTEAGNRKTYALITFVQIHESSQVIPLPGVPTLFVDVKTAEDVTDSNEPRPPQDFRGFSLHKVIYLGVGTPAGQVAFPHLQSKTLSHWAPMQRLVITPELEEMPQLTVALSAADSNNWNIGNDPIFPSCLAKFRARHKASQASGATKSTRRHGSHRESSASTHELPFPATPQPSPPPTLGWHEVDDKVTEVMDQLHNLHLETVQEMGFIRAVDQAMAKSIMVEFLWLRLIAGDNLNTTLWTWHADMEATTEEFLSHLDLATQTSTTLPSKNAAILDLHYEEDFREKQSHQVPVIFSDPLFIPNMANTMYEAFKTPVLPKASPFAGGCRVPSTLSQPEDGGPKPEKSEPERSEPEMSAQSTSKTSQRVQEQVTETSDTDSDKTDEPTLEKEPPCQGPKSRSPVNSRNAAARPWQAAPKMVPLPPR